MPYFVTTQKVDESLELTTKQKFYVKFDGVKRKKCKKCGESYWPIRIKPKGFEKDRCIDCLINVLCDPATKILENFY